jgi:DinB superfamily
MSQLDKTSLAALSNFPELLEAAYAAVPIDRKNWRPKSWDGIPSERLTAIEQICHVHDIEIDGYHVRFHRALTEDQPVLPDLAGELLAQERNYSAADASGVLANFKAARAETIRIVSALKEDQLNRVAIFENRPTTLRGLVHFLCSHDFQHLAGLQWLLAMMSQARSES